MEEGRIVMKWEYLVSVLSEIKPQQEVLNPLGKQGWELVTVVAFEGERTAYFKRSIEETQEGIEVNALSLEAFEAKMYQVIRERF